MSNVRPNMRPKSPDQKNTGGELTDPMLSADAIDALADIAKRTYRLADLYAERLKTDDGYQVIDPRTIAAAFQEFTRTGKVDPVRMVHEQFRLWADMGLLLQQTAACFLFNSRAEPVISPSPQDKRFKNE